MGSFVDLTGNTYSKLTVLSRTKNVGIQPAWNCTCSCGNTTSVMSCHLKNGKTKSCGCLVGAKPLDLIGQVFGKLTVIKLHKDKPPVWEAKCSCGSSKLASSKSLLNGELKSCGCLTNSTKNLTGQQFGNSTAIERYKKDRVTYWKLLCGCGQEFDIGQRVLLKAKDPNCGCSKVTLNSSIGLKFEKLTVLSIDNLNDQVKRLKLPMFTPPICKPIDLLKQGILAQSINELAKAFSMRRY